MKLTKTNYVAEAEKVVSKLERDKGNKICLTTSKIRNLLTMISSIYNDVIHTAGEQIDDDIVERIQYLKMRFAYEAGRNGNKPVKDLIEKAEIWNVINGIGRDKEKCIIFCRYMEAIVAYHKFYGGRD